MLTFTFLIQVIEAVTLPVSIQKLEDKVLRSLTQSVWVEGPLKLEISETQHNNNCLKIHMWHRHTRTTNTRTKTWDTVSRTLMVSTSIRARNDASIQINLVIMMAFNKCTLVFLENTGYWTRWVRRRLASLWLCDIFSRDSADFLNEV